MKADKNMLVRVKWGITAIIIASLIFFLYKTDMTGVRAGLTDVGAGFLGIVVVTFLAHLCGAISWSFTLPNSQNISFIRLFMIRFLGENIGLINPMNIIGGDTFKAFMLEKEGVTYPIGFSSLLVSRGIMIFTQIGMFLLAAVCYIFIAGEQKSSLFEVITLTLVSLGFMGVMVLYAPRLMRSEMFGQMHAFLRKRGITKKWRNIKEEIEKYYSDERKRFYKSILWSIANFLIGSIEVWIIFYFLGIEISYLEALLIDQGVLFLKSFGAFIPGQIGVEEYSNKLMFAIVGITSVSIWITVSILRRARQILWIIVGLVIYYAVFFKERKISFSSKTVN